MRVLLIGEFSGVHNNLKKGLEACGIEVFLANTGDVFKQFSTDMVMHIGGMGRFRQIQNIFLELSNLHKMKKFDVIQVMNPNALEFYNHKRVYEMLDSAKLVVQLIGGCDFVSSYYNRYLCKEMCDMCKRYDIGDHICPYSKGDTIRYQKQFYQYADIFVPLCWEYYHVYKRYAHEYENRLLPVMPMPIDLEENKFVDCKNSKIQVLHPLNRVGAKGTKVIEEAFERLRQKYGDIADFQIKGKMPIKEYRKLLARMDIVVDQLYGSTYGMNALYAMAMGKIVFSGEPDRRMYDEEPILREMPIYGLGYGVEDIVKRVAQILDDGNLLERKKQSRQFVEKYHDSKAVAEKFLSLYESYID